MVQQPTPAAGQPGGVPEKPDPVQAELALAKEAFDQGKFLEPAGESALDYYRSALALDPNSDAAKEGIRAVVDKILERAEAALTAEKLEEAIRNIETARDIDASHPRLSFLDTQIARERERLKLSQAAGSGQPRADAGRAGERSHAERPPDHAGERQRARRAGRSAPPRSDRSERRAGDSRVRADSLTEEARKSLAAGKTDEAQSVRERRASAGLRRRGARRGRARSSPRPTRAATAAAGAAARAATAAATAARTSIRMVADVRQRMSEGKLIDPPGDSARDLLVNLRNAAPTRPEVDELSRALTTRLLDVRQAGDGCEGVRPRADS